MKNVADATGWMDELGTTQVHNLTVHAGIAALTIIVLFILLAQLLSPSDGGKNSQEEDL